MKICLYQFRSVQKISQQAPSEKRVRVQWGDRSVSNRNCVFSNRGFVKMRILLHVFACALSLSPGALFITSPVWFLVNLPVGRTQAVYQYRSSLSAFGESWFGKRACLHCFLKHDTLVLDSEWHWMFDCTLFWELRLTNPYFFDFFKTLQKVRGYAVIDDLGKLLTAI